MEIKSRFDHYNINVVDLQKSLDFYEKALGLKEVRRKDASDGSFTLVYIGEETTGFTLELTWLRDWDRPYNLGDNYELIQQFEPIANKAKTNLLKLEHKAQSFKL